MSKTSLYGRIVDIADGAFSVDEPCDCGSAFLYRNNLAHLIDQKPQVRINWSSLNPASTVTYFAASGSCSYREEFPFTFLSPTKPANLYVQVGFESVDASGAADNNYRVSIVPANAAYGDVSRAIFNETSLSGADRTPTSVSGTIIGTDYLEQLRSAWEPVGLMNDGDTFRPMKLFMLRLEIDIVIPGTLDSEDAFAIFQVYVAEHA